MIKERDGELNQLKKKKTISDLKLMVVPMKVLMRVVNANIFWWLTLLNYHLSL